MLPKERSPGPVRGAGAGREAERVSKAVLHLGEGMEPGFLREVEQEAGTKVSLCYQCGKCAASCPVSFVMDLEPYQVMRLVQLGARDEVLRSRTIWLCASCTACSERCPREVDVAAAMDALRVLARRAGYRPAEGQIALFHGLFLDSVRDTGRLHELGLMLRYKLKTGDLFSDLDVGLPMMRHGKLKPVPHRIRGTEQMRVLFWRVRARETAAVHQSTGAARESEAAAGGRPEKGGEGR